MKLLRKISLVDFYSHTSIFIFSAISVFGLFIWQGHAGLSLWDEGFLWYGAQRVMVGEVPLRDFMSYDIGRYYWSAAVMNLVGNKGIVAMRLAISAFEAIALFMGLRALVRSSSKQHFLFWYLAGLTLLAWMAPQYRVFDIALPIILVSVLAFLVERPSSRRYLLTGLVVGLAAVFGRNHGLYGVFGSLSVIAYLNIKHENDVDFFWQFTPWLAGIVLGYLPVLFFIAFVPEFAQAFTDSIWFLFDVKATNIALPVPWPWLIPFRSLSANDIFYSVIQGIFFVAIVLFGLQGLIWAILKKIKQEFIPPVLLASISLALPYAHYAYSRADIEHLAPGSMPFVIGILSLIVRQTAKIKWLIAILMCGASLWLMLPMHSGWDCLTRQCVETRVLGDTLKIDVNTSSQLNELDKLAKRYALGGRTFIVEPFWPGAYAALGSKSPIWEIYALFPRSRNFQQAEIERIKTANPGFVVIYDLALDGREDLLFRNTHSLVDQYIRENFVFLEHYVKNPVFRIYISKHASNE